MDPIPPRKPKDLPFYETPEHLVTSAKIISEAKNSLSRPQLRPINTKRPVTPQDSQRKLFGEQSIRDPTNRPPSAFSLGSRHFDSESRPVSGTRLTPLDHKPKTCDIESVMSPKPPADPNRPVSGLRRPGSRQRLLVHSNSVDAPLDGIVRSRSGSLDNISGAGLTQATSSSVPTTPEAQRRVHSGPKERTRLSPERLDGDGPKTTQSRGNSGKRRSRGQDGERAESGYASDARENSAGSQRASSSSKTGSAGRREEETTEEAHFYNTRVAPIVEEISSHIKEKDQSQLIMLSDKLYKTMEEGKLLGRACKRRGSILKTVFKLLDVDSPHLLLKLARLILALRVSGNNLTNVCKLVFKVSREEKHDSYFAEGNILELLIEVVRTTDHLASTEALVYCVGALKFLSGNTKLLKILVKHNCLEALAKLLVAINKTNGEAGKSNDQYGHILVQLTSTLRNLGEVSSMRGQFLSLHIIQELCHILEMYSTDADLMLNVSRIFSKLTMHGDCCNAVASKSSHFRSFVHLLKIYQRREDLMVRISFILGNLTAKNDQSRTRLFQQPKSFDILLGVLKYYIEQDQKAVETNSRADPEEARSQSKTEDVLIKVIRVIANLSINEEIGAEIATNETFVKLLLDILGSKEITSSEELVLNTMSTVNNLSYYNVKNSAILLKELQLAKCLMRFLNVENMEGLGEATRVYGNLSRSKSVRDFLVKHKVDEMMVALLDSGNREVVFASCGVLINLMADEEKRPMLQKNGGIKSLIEVLRDFSRCDWHLGSMVCMILWNYSGKITSANACFGEHETQELAELLIEYLDEEAALDESLNPDFDEEMKVFIRNAWQTEFCPVASQLLNRIEANQSELEPLVHPS